MENKFPFLSNLIQSEEELKIFLKEYDKHIGLKKQVKPEFKFMFGKKI